MEESGFSVIMQLHGQPPIETKAIRPRLAREFMPGITLKEVWQWVEENSRGFSVESVEIRGLSEPLHD